MRTASLIVLSGLFVQVAHAADDIRLSTFPNGILGTWAETAQQCAAKDKSNVVIEPAKYGDGDGSCAVSWIDQSDTLPLPSSLSLQDFRQSHSHRSRLMFQRSLANNLFCTKLRGLDWSQLGSAAIMLAGENLRLSIFRPSRKT